MLSSLSCNYTLSLCLMLNFAIVIADVEGELTRNDVEDVEDPACKLWIFRWDFKFEVFPLVFRTFQHTFAF